MKTSRQLIIAFLWIAIAVAIALPTTGCLRNHWRHQDDGYRDLPNMPKQDFGRRKQRLGQMGFDSRAKEIEASLGVE